MALSAGRISFDFDGVLSTLVLGRAWEKTREKKRPVPVLSPAVRGLKRGLAALTEGLDGVLDAAEVGRLDLDHVAGLGGREVDDVLVGVAPFVGHDLDRGAHGPEPLADGGQELDLARLPAGVDRALDVEGEFRGDGLERGQVVGDAVGPQGHDDPDRSVDVDVEGRDVGRVGPEPADAPDQPAEVLPQQLALVAELGLDVVDEGVGQDVDPLHDHLVDVDVAVVAALAEDGHALGDDGQAVLVADDLGHDPVGRQGPGVEKGLRQAVTDGRVEAPAVELEGLETGGHLAEGADLGALEEGPYPCLEQGQAVRGQEEGVAAAGPGVLDRGAVAQGPAAVLEEEQDRQGLAGDPDGPEARGLGRPAVEGAVVGRAALDGLLVVEVEGRRPGHEQGSHDLHLGLPMSLPLLMA